MRQNETLSENEPAALNGNQLAALPYLVAAPTMVEGTRLANIARATLYRWMNDDDFRRTLEGLRAHAADLAHTELRGLMLKSVLVLAEAMEDSNPGVRRRARRAVARAQGHRPQGAPAPGRPARRGGHRVGQEEHSPVIPTLKALERRLVEERTEIAAARCVDRFLLTWELAAARGSAPPTSLDFAHALNDERLHLLTIPGAMQYLDERHAHKSLPDRKRLLRILLTFGWRGPTAADLLALEDRVRSEVPDQRRRSRRRRRRSRAPREGGGSGPGLDHLGL